MHRRTGSSSSGEGDMAASAGTPSATTKWSARVSTNPFAALDSSNRSSSATVLDFGDQSQRSEEEKGDDVQWKDSTVFLQEVTQRDEFTGGFGATFVHGKENLA